MGRVDPEIVAASDVAGGEKANVFVTFVANMDSQNPVTYHGDVDALGENPPDFCPSTPPQNPVLSATLEVPTVEVTQVKHLVVRVHGPNKVKEDTVTVSPSPS